MEGVSLGREICPLGFGVRAARTKFREAVGATEELLDSQARPEDVDSLLPVLGLANDLSAADASAVGDIAETPVATLERALSLGGMGTL